MWHTPVACGNWTWSATTVGTSHSLSREYHQEDSKMLSWLHYTMSLSPQAQVWLHNLYANFSWIICAVSTRQAWSRLEKVFTLGLASNALWTCSTKPQSNETIFAACIIYWWKETNEEKTLHVRVHVRLHGVSPSLTTHEHPCVFSLVAIMKIVIGQGA